MPHSVFSDINEQGWDFRVILKDAPEALGAQRAGKRVRQGHKDIHAEHEGPQG